MQIDNNGHVIHPRVRLAISKTIERGRLATVRGIVVHQTDSATAQATLNSYRNPKAHGAHFLIDGDGVVYQTASVHHVTWHVGRLKARCLAEHRCSPVETQALKKFDSRREHQQEMAKATPDRYPGNHDSLGIEIVGLALPHDTTTPQAKRVFETVNSVQNDSLKWLVQGLALAFKVPMTEVFRHPDIAYKNPTEASTAVWR